ncbi:E3 SUMO-protein ligase PIAS4 isoform X2 [Aethina tumida]|uniref:E3 SUMO-protein ligase PIAS4 isoform X2 n=1 Tax=Aethina tumida TaxID=116153 RepID=UPI002148D0BA|nr:E3 SUMO-protein ligase PIAS4 isoform X2 [Aethina tumida]
MSESADDLEDVQVVTYESTDNFENVQAMSESADNLEDVQVMSESADDLEDVQIISESTDNPNCEENNDETSRSNLKRTHSEEASGDEGNPATIPKQPRTENDLECTFKDGPFMRTLDVVLKPMILKPKRPRLIATQDIELKLSDPQMVLFNKAKELNYKKYEVVIRFGRNDTTVEKIDCYPSRLSVYVNNVLVNLPVTIEGASGDAMPIIITHYLKFRPNILNSLWVRWKNTPTIEYVMGVYVTKLNLYEDILKTFVDTCTRDANITREIIRKKFSEHDDCVVVSKNNKIDISLLCPVTKNRMEYPCRATTCTHLQCFDGNIFLKMNNERPRWRCPICNNAAIYRDLFLDSFFKNILDSEALPASAEEIQVHQDGSWNVVQEEVEQIVL